MHFSVDEENWAFGKKMHLVSRVLYSSKSFPLPRTWSLILNQCSWSHNTGIVSNLHSFCQTSVIKNHLINITLRQHRKHFACSKVALWSLIHASACYWKLSLIRKEILPEVISFVFCWTQRNDKKRFSPSTSVFMWKKIFMKPTWKHQCGRTMLSRVNCFWSLQF